MHYTVIAVNQPVSQYSVVARSLHWLVALLFLVAYVFISMRGIFPKGSEMREAMKMVHFSAGCGVLLLFLPRIAARVVSRPPAIVPPLVRWQSVAATATHFVLYGLMVAIPLAGYLYLNASGKPVSLFGLTLPTLIGEMPEIAKTLKDIHKSLANLGYAAIALHIGAALFHHRIVRDNTLVRMLPRLRSAADKT